MLRFSHQQTDARQAHSENLPMLDALLKARSDAGLTQAEVAARMGTQASAIARLESAFIVGKPSPSVSTLTRYARALGKELELRFV